MTPEQRHRARFYIDHEQQMARRRAELLAQQPWWSPRGSRVFLWFAGLAVLVLAGCLSAGWALQ